MQRGCAGRSWELLHVWQVINTGFVRSVKKHAQTDKFVHKFRVRNVLNVAIIKKNHNPLFLGGILVHLVLIPRRVILLFCGINMS